MAIEQHVAYFREAVHLAQLSNDPSTQVGAIIPWRMLGSEDNVDVEWNSAVGYNRFLPSIKETTERLNDGVKKNLMITHAERNAIKSYVRDTGGQYPNGLPLYATWAACANCALEIIDHGIKYVVTDYNIFEYSQRVRPAESAMMWEQSIHVALDMFEDAGVKFYAVDDLYDHAEESDQDLKIRVSGHDYYPFRKEQNA